MSETKSIDLDATFSLLADSRRRYLLYHLLESEYVTVEKLSLRIAAWEQGIPSRAVSEDDRVDVAISLVHNHLPRLAEQNVVDYDARSGDVVPSEGLAEIRPFVENAQSTERAEEISETSLLSFLYSKPPEDPYLVEEN